LCDASCQCPVPCLQDDLTAIKAHVDAKRFKVRGALRNFGGAFNGADPRQRFTLTLTQGANTLTVDIPANDAGWVESRPLKGRYKWTGNLNGITRVRAVDRSATQGVWRIVVVGKAVPGGAAIDILQPVDITLTIDSVCTTTTF
jgi:hypothetical protein